MSRSIPSFFIVFLLGNIPNFVSYLLEFDEFCERIVNTSRYFDSKSIETRFFTLFPLPLKISRDKIAKNRFAAPFSLRSKKHSRNIFSHPSSCILLSSLRRVEQQETRRTRGASEEEEGGARQARHLATSGESTLPRLIKSKSCASHSSPSSLHSPKSCEPTSFD